MSDGINETRKGTFFINRSKNLNMNKGILFFSAPWCSACKQIEPKVDILISEGVRVNKVNCDYDAVMTERYKIKSIPTLILTDMQGNEIKRMVGAQSNLQQLKEWYNG